MLLVMMMMSCLLVVSGCGPFGIHVQRAKNDPVCTYYSRRVIMQLVIPCLDVSSRSPSPMSSLCEQQPGTH
jgi:hypothetical protein